VDGQISKKRVVIGDRTALMAFQRMARYYHNDVMLSSGQTSVGHNITSFCSLGGVEANFIEHPLFNLMQSQKGTAFVLDIPTIRLHYLGSRDAIETFNSLDGSKTGNHQDASSGSLTSELTLSISAPENNMFMSGLLDGGADPVRVVATAYMATFFINKGSDQDCVETGQQVTISIRSAKPDTTYTIYSPTGDELQIAVDASGNGDLPFTIGTNQNSVFSVKVGEETKGVVFDGLVASVQRCKICDELS
jgi:hypothetical protein